MEIIHVVLGKANPSRLNGVNKVVFNLASEQHNAGKNVKLWGISSNLEHDYPARNFETTLFKAEKNPFKVNEELIQNIIKNKTSVFHLHGGWIPVFSSLSKIFIKHKIKYVITPHGAYNSIAMNRSKWRKKLYFQLFEKTIIKNAHYVHSIGQSEVDGLSNLCKKAKSFLLPYGFHYQQENINSEKNTDFTIGFVGRLDTHTKGLDLLLKAFYNFQKTNPFSKLWIIGEGEGKAFIEKFIEVKNLKNVVLWGKKFGEEKDTLISKMHVFAHPSRNEGLPTAVLEASALGTPVIVSKATNVADYVTQFSAGIAIDNENADQLKQAIDKMFEIYNTEKQNKLIEGGKKMLENVFSWSVLVDKYDELYK